MSERTRHMPLAQSSRLAAVALQPQPALAYAGSQQLSLSAAEERRFHGLYCEHFDFVFRNLRRLGVSNASLDDALQDVYLVVLRRIRELPQDAHAKAWMFAILLRVASNYRRSQRRRGRPESLAELPVASPQPGPFELTARAQAAQFLRRFLGSLDEDRRAAFIMSELEQLTAPEISRALDANVNTVYSWLRGLRSAFLQALQQEQRAPGVERG